MDDTPYDDTLWVVRAADQAPHTDRYYATAVRQPEGRRYDRAGRECPWTKVEDPYLGDSWRAACGFEFDWIDCEGDDSPAEHGFDWCPKCRGKVTVG